MKTRKRKITAFYLTFLLCFTSISLFRCLFSPKPPHNLIACSERYFSNGLFPSSCFSNNSKPTLEVEEGHSTVPYSIVYSPDGKTLASSDSDGNIELWDVENSVQIGTWHVNDPVSVTFSPDGKSIVSGGYDDTVRIWSLYEGKEVMRIKAGMKAVKQVAVSPDGKFIAATGFRTILRIWAVADGKLRYSEPGVRKHYNAGEALKYSSSGKYLAVNSLNDDSIIIHTVPDMKIKHKFKKSHESVSYGTSIAFSPDDRFIAYIDDEFDKNQRLIVRNLDTGKIFLIIDMKSVSKNEEIAYLEFTKDGKSILSGGKFYSVREWSLDKGKQVIAVGKGGMATIALSPDGETIAAYSSGNNISLWSIRTGRLIRKIDTVLTDGTISVAALSPDARSLALSVRDQTGYSSDATKGSFQLWNLRKSRIEKTLRKSGLIVDQAQYYHDGKLLAGIVGDGRRNDRRRILVWNVSSGEVVKTINEDWDELNSFSVSDDGSILLAYVCYKDSMAGCENFGFVLWKTHDWRRVGLIKGKAAGTWAFALSPDGKNIAIASCDITGFMVDQYVCADTNIELYGTTTGKLNKRIEVHREEILSISYSRDGKFLTITFEDSDHPEFNYYKKRYYKGKNNSYSGMSRIDVKNGVTIKTVILYSGDYKNRYHINTGELGYDTIALDNSEYNAPVLFVQIWNKQNMKFLRTIKIEKENSGSMTLVSGGSKILSFDYAKMHILNAASGDLLLTMETFTNGGWLATTPDGKFDCSSCATEKAENIKGFHWRIGARIFPFKAFFDKYYSPGLLGRYL